MSPKSSAMAKRALQKHFTDVKITCVNDLEDLDSLVSRRPDVAFIGLKRLPRVGSPNEANSTVWVADYLESSGIATTGSGSSAIKLELDKTKAKDKVIAAGLNTSPYFVVKQGSMTRESQMTIDYPLFLKPPSQGAGAGIDAQSVVRNYTEYTTKVSSIHASNGSPAMVEKYFSGREFTVALLQDLDSNNLNVMPIEQLPTKNHKGDAVIGHAMKNSDTETAVRLVGKGSVRDLVKKLAEDVYVSLGARDYARIDIRLDDNNVPHFLEANLVPGLINGSGNFQKACQLNHKIDYEQMLVHIVKLAQKRISKFQTLLEADPGQTSKAL